MQKKLILIIPFFLLLFDVSFAQISDTYKNFKVAIYTHAYEVRQMNDMNWLEPIWNTISDQLHVDKAAGWPIIGF